MKCGSPVTGFLIGSISASSTLCRVCPSADLELDPPRVASAQCVEARGELIEEGLLRLGVVEWIEACLREEGLTDRPEPTLSQGCETDGRRRLDGAPLHAVGLVESREDDAVQPRVDVGQLSASEGPVRARDGRVHETAHRKSARLGDAEQKPELISPEGPRDDQHDLVDAAAVARPQTRELCKREVGVGLRARVLLRERLRVQVGPEAVVGLSGPKTSHTQRGGSRQDGVTIQHRAAGLDADDPLGPRDAKLGVIQLDGECRQEVCAPGRTAKCRTSRRSQ